MRTLLMFVTVLPLMAADAWKAGVAQAVITPQEPIWMAGYGDRVHPSTGVLRNLYVKALALDSGDGKPSVIVTADLLGFPKEISDAVAARCEKQYGMARAQLVLNASHTHSGPVTHRHAFPIFNLEETQWQAIDRYSTFLTDKTVGVIGAALQNITPATVKFEQGFAGIAVNRRRAHPGTRGLTGQVDHDVPVMTIEGADGKLRAVLVGYACHATVLNIYQISGDWPGFAQEEIEKAHPGAIALFMQGCGADANPLPRRTVELARLYGSVLAAAVDDVLKSKMRLVEGPIRSAYEIVDVPYHQVPSNDKLVPKLPFLQSDIVQNYAAYDALLKLPQPRFERYLFMAKDGKMPDHYPYPVEVWQFGHSLKFIALGGEVVSDYSLRLKGQYGWENTWVSGYSNDVFGYTPSARVLHEGGYEADSSGYVSQFSPAIEELIVEKVAELVASTSKPIAPVERRRQTAN
jgi:neutral ceramidase